MRFRKILVALDNPQRDEVVFKHALSLAQSGESHLKLVHCLSLDIYHNLGSMLDAGAGLRSSSNVLKEDEADLLERVQAARSWLANLRDRVMAQDIAVDFICEVDEPGLLICRLGQDWNADVIVVGNSGKKGLKRLVLGSVSNHVVKHAPCLTIVVPWDGSSPMEYSPGEATECRKAEVRRQKTEGKASIDWDL
jgi:nucleotide-binding universal stress UspA family protein